MTVGPLGRPKGCFYHRSRLAEHTEGFWSHPLTPISPTLGTIPDPPDRLGIPLELGLSGLGQLIYPPAFLTLGADESFILELLQGGVNRARAGSIKSAGALLQFLDQLVAMLGPLLEQRKNGESYLAELKEPAPWSTGKAGPRTPLFPGPPSP